MPKQPKPLSLFLVEQDVTNLGGEYLTECVVAARHEKHAMSAAVALGDDKDGFGLVVRDYRLTVTRLGPLEVKLARHQARFLHDGALVLAVGTGLDVDVLIPGDL